MLKWFSLSLSLFFVNLAQAQIQLRDTTKQLDEVIVYGFLNRQPLQQIPASVALVSKEVLLNTSQQSLLPALNTVPGVRMEERSPGSYRLSIRGSLLRSPFGVRNVKVYVDDLPFTDASGNAYVNLIDPVFIQRAEILKGPDGSLFGANSGGVVLFNTLDHADTARLTGSVSGGSFGLFRQHTQVNHAGKRMRWSIGEAFQRADGYRQHSAMRRFNLMGKGSLLYGANQNELRITALYTDLHYETPGGLTRAQFNEKPEQARPATGMAQGAVEQRAGIYNKTFFQGITHEWNIAEGLRHVASVFGTVTDFRNPFITNYETRTEYNGGFRTFFEYALTGNTYQLVLHAGAEGQQGRQEFFNYENNGGVRGVLQQSDVVRLSQLFYFSRVRFTVGKRFTAEAAVSLNQQKYRIHDDKRTLSNEWMPRLAASYRIIEPLVLRASASKGYSPPASAEIRPSGGIINQTLQAEWGWSYEAGARLALWNGRLQADVSVFRYDLQSAITRRTTEEDVEYFLNAGGTQQTGAEAFVQATLIANRNFGFMRAMTVHSSYTYSDFLFDHYENDGNDFSGNRLTGVPEHNVVFGVTIGFPQALQLYVQSLNTSRIPLNDANTELAKACQLLQARVGWKGIRSKSVAVEFFVGVDNLLNQTYSLGNDINAFGGRYYNAAPPMNFYGGLQAKLF